MVRRSGWPCLCLALLGCQSFFPLQGEPEPVFLAGQIWEQGQSAMAAGQVDEAIRCYERSLVADPALSRCHLSLAAAYLEKNDAAQASAHLQRYVAAHPEQLVVRSRYAELQIRLRRFEEAWRQFELLAGDAQDYGLTAADTLIDCHSRLVELAERRKDDYAAHLNRGIGLFWLARERSNLPDPEGELPAEALLCQSAAELTLAHLQRPDQARPCWYLYEVWKQLGQSQPALCRLRQAEKAAPFSYLTAVEGRDLELAFERYRIEARHGG
jgi:tetratricopeptide (TPR) repeat protein